MKRLVFMGTPEWALPSLEALIASGHPVVGVWTQPDRPVGRKQVPTPSPVKAWAQKQGLPVWTPERAGAPDSLEALQELTPDLILVCAYGQLLPQALLDLPPCGCFNLHFSLLPRWRGASPVQAALAAGDTETGVSLQQMVLKLDAGPLVAEQREPIAPEDTSETLGTRLATLGGRLVADTLPALLNQTAVAVPQDPAQVTFCRIIRKEQGQVLWEEDTARQVERRLRAYTPWPGCFSFGPDGKRLQLVEVEVTEAQRPPGEIGPGFEVGTAEGALRLLKVRPEGKGEMAASAFLNGRPDWVGQKMQTRR